MIYFKLLDEKMIEGKTYKEIVLRLWKLSFDGSADTKTEYMENLMKRVKVFTKRVNIELNEYSDKYEKFIRKLEKLKLATIMEIIN